MDIVTLCILLLAVSFGRTQDVSQEETSEEHPRLAEGEKKMSDNILKVIEHFKQEDPVGIPGVDIPDPYPVPELKQSLSIGTMYFKNTALYGIRKFRIISIDVEIGDMEVDAHMKIDKLQARGNYTLLTWLNKAQGPYTVDVTGLQITAHGNIGVERDGKLRVQDITIDMSFSNIAMNFENLGFFGSMFQGVINSIGTFLFDSIKPFILKEAYSKLRIGINSKLDEVVGDMQFPNSISPLDMVITDARDMIRDKKLDPYIVKDYNTTASIFTVALSHTWITGISSFHRVGNISLKIENLTLIADIEIGTQKLVGSTQWDISAVGGLMSRAGTASLTIEYISGRFILSQPLDTRKKPKIDDIQLEIGNIQVRCDGAGTIDYMLEFVVNILPNLLRYQIMDGIETPAKEYLQKTYLDLFDVEETIKEELLPRLDSMDEENFKLSTHLGKHQQEVKYDEDEFFNF